MLQRFRGNRDFRAFDKTKPIAVTARDLDESGDDSGEDAENVNQQNVRAGSRTERVQGAKLLALNAELKEIEQKWWLQGDEESVKRSILAQKD